MSKLIQIKTVTRAGRLVGDTPTGTHIFFGFSSATKLPCPTYSLPATACKTGSKLAKIEGTTCSDCYALRGPMKKGMSPKKIGWYLAPHTLNAAMRRLKAVLSEPLWLEAMDFLFSWHKLPFFRWHDSGDLQSLEHFTKICKIARFHPETKFWLPTREYDIIYKFWQLCGEIPLNCLYPNLIIRLSAYNTDGPSPDQLAKKLGVLVSRDSTKIWDCPASKQDNKCLDCRKCWNPKIFCITYHHH